jgi:hypothetical protein
MDMLGWFKLLCKRSEKAATNKTMIACQKQVEKKWDWKCDG